MYEDKVQGSSDESSPPLSFYLVLPGAARPIAFCSKFMYVNNTAMMSALLTE
jgi:hypothetical protein